MTKQQRLQAVAAAFGGNDRFLEAKPHGNGHINDTYAMYYETPAHNTYRILVRRLNKEVFKNPSELANNIKNITEFIKEKIRRRGGDPLRETLTVLQSADGNNYFLDDRGEYWQAMLFIENATAFETCRTEEDIYSCGRTFGEFQKMLSDYPVDKLVETIPDFHNTQKRFETFKQAVAEDKAGRAAGASAEINTVLQHADDMHCLTDCILNGVLPLRVTHNDTKLNNVLIDNATGKAICVIDLDTVMPGLCCYDFGDFVRFACNTAAEDEPETDKVHFSYDTYTVFSRGYLASAKAFLTPHEAASLPVGARIMTLECGMRFLTDYLNGDVYFKTQYPEHNLVRCRTQLAMLRDMERHSNEMKQLIDDLYNAK